MPIEATDVVQLKLSGLHLISKHAGRKIVLPAWPSSSSLMSVVIQLVVKSPPLGSVQELLRKQSVYLDFGLKRTTGTTEQASAHE